jgi:hypothetical protein
VGYFWISFYWKHLVVLSFLAPIRVALAASLVLIWRLAEYLIIWQQAKDVQLFDVLRQDIRAISTRPVSSSILIVPPFGMTLLWSLNQERTTGIRLFSIQSAIKKAILMSSTFTS